MRNTFFILLVLTVLLSFSCTTPKAIENKTSTTQTLIPLIRFDNKIFCKDWNPNAWGGGTCKIKFVENSKDKFPVFLQADFKNTKTTLSNPKLFQSLSDIIAKTPANGLYLWYRLRQEKGDILAVVRGRDNQGKSVTITQNYLRANDGEWHLAKLPFYANKGIHLGLNITFGIHGSGSLEIGEIGLLCGGRPMPKVRKFPELLVLKHADSPITVDGVINEKAWKNATTMDLSLSEADSKLCKGKPPKEKTRVFVAWSPEGIYCAARCFKTDMKKLKANFTKDAPDIWYDECVEFLFDPNRSEAYYQMLKFAINANGKIGSHLYNKQKNVKYRVAAKKYNDRWETELFIPRKCFGDSWEGPGCLGFNARRFTYDGKKIAEDMAWTTRHYAAVKDFGVLLVEPSGAEPPDSSQVKNLMLNRIQQGGYVISGDNNSGKTLNYSVKVFSPAKGKLLTNEKGILATGKIEIPVRFSVNKDGVYNLVLLIYDKQNHILTFFEANPPEEISSLWKPLAIDDIAIFPEPKFYQRRKGNFTFTKNVTYTLTSPEIKFCGKLLARDLKAYYGLNLKKVSKASEATIILDLNSTSAPARKILKSQKLDKKFKAIVYDGFLVSIGPKRILVTAKEPRGVLYGVNTLLELIKMTSGDIGPAKVGCTNVVDWPAFRNRHWHHMLWGAFPAQKRTPAIYDDILNRIPLHFRYNGFLLEVGNYYNWQCYPDLGKRQQAWTLDEFREVIRFLNKRYVPVIPFLETLGHANWLLTKHQELREDGDSHTICTNHPDTYPILFALVDEMIEMCRENPKYQPEYFHIGLDEVRWKTKQTPPEKQCKLCQGVPKNKVFIGHIKKMNDYLKQKGLRTAMYSDMVVDEHNGLNQFKCSKIIDRLPKDIIMCHWLSRLENPSIPRFDKLGIDNWKTVTAYQLDRQHEDQTKGRAFMGYGCNWWLSFTRHGFGGSIYGPMAQAIYSNVCWNLYPDDDNSTWRKYSSIYGNLLMHNWSRKPLPGATKEITSVDLTPVINEVVIDDKAGDGEGWFDTGSERDLSLMKLQNGKIHGVQTAFSKKAGKVGCLKLDKLNKQSATIRFGKKAGSLILLHAAYLDVKKDFHKFRQRKNYPDPLHGLPIARYTVKYIDGKTAVFNALFGWNVSQWNIDSMSMAEVFSKYILDARSLVEGHTKLAKEKNMPSDIALYQYEWSNPRPGIPIESIKVEALKTYVNYALLAISARGAME